MKITPFVAILPFALFGCSPSPDSLLNEGTSLITKGELDRAATVLKQVPSSTPQHGRAVEMLSQISSLKDEEMSRSPERLARAADNCSKVLRDCECSLSTVKDDPKHFYLDIIAVSGSRCSAGITGDALPSLWSGAFGYGLTMNHGYTMIDYQWGPPHKNIGGVKEEGIKPTLIAEIRIALYDERRIPAKVDNFGHELEPQHTQRRLRRRLFLKRGAADNFDWYGPHMYEAFPTVEREAKKATTSVQENGSCETL